MASFLQKSNPWIENTFTFAISFNPDTEEGFGNNRDTPNNKNNNNNDNGEESDIFNSQYYNESERGESSQYLQTENTIPEGLVGTPEKQKAVGGGLVGGGREDELNGITKDVIEAPSRQSKIAQVISRGGNFNYYNTHNQVTDTTSNNTNNNNNNHNNNKKKASSNNKEESNCPPYLIIHDGEYSTIAFLSPEVCAEYTNNNNSNIPPNKSLISITHYTVSTIYQCCTTSSSSTIATTNNNNNNSNSNNNTTHLQIIKNLQTNPRTIPQPYTTQIQNQIQNPKLYTCLYIQSSIIIIGAENQGLINNPIDVHCSVLLRRCLIAHEMQNGRIGSGTGSSDDNVGMDRQEEGGNENEEREKREEHSHNVLITRLEAVHLHYQDLAEKKFHDEQHELNQLQLHHPVQQEQQQQQQQLGGLTAPNSPSSPTTSSLASNSPTPSPHTKKQKKQYGRRRNNKKQQQQVGKKDSPYKRIGVSVVIPPEWPWVSRLVVEEQQEGGKEVGNNCLIKEEPVDENEMQKRINMNMNSIGQQEQEQEVNGGLEDVVQSVPEEEGENDKVIEKDNDDDNTKETDASAAVLPREKEDQESSSKPASRSIGNVIELFDNFDDIEEVLDLTELDDDDDDDDDDNAAATAMDGTNIKTADKKASIGMLKDDNEGDDTTTSPSRGNNNTVSFVGIDDMLVDDDDDDDSEDDDNQLFTQPPDYVEEGGGGFSQIPMALKRRGSPKARFKKMNQNDEQQIVESQVPLPLTRKVASEKSPRRQHSLDEEDKDEFPQSQIPLPSRRASKKSVPPSELNDDEEDDGILYQESQIPLPMKKKKKKESPLPSKKSKRWRKNMQEEETVPRSLRKQPPETLNVSGNDRRQSQIPLPTKKRVSNEGQVAAKEEDDRRQSQIPLPTRKKKIHGHGKRQANRFSLQSNHYKSSRQYPRYSESEEDEDDNADGRIEMSQVPINTKKQSTRRKSPLKPKPKVDDYSSDASSDGWMQIRRTAKPKIKSKKSRSSLQSNHFGRKFDDSLERVGKMKSNSSRSKAQPPAKRTKYEDSDDDSEDEQSQSRMAAGEGSEESLPPRKRLRGDDEVLGSKNDPTVQNSTVASKANAILGTSPPISSRTKQSNDDGLSLEGFKIVKNKKRKGNFDMSSFLENTKKFAWL